MELITGFGPVPELLHLPTGADIEFMRGLEEDFKRQTGLKNRSQYKIFYGPVWRAPILLLGINPAGDPAEVAADGVQYQDNRDDRAASSIGYYENGEHDLLDCTWNENTGLRKLLLPILGTSERIRRFVVKTNLAFIRLRNTKNAEDKHTIDCFKNHSAPFLRRFLGRVRPGLILLTGVKLYDFANRYCAEVIELSDRQEEPGVNQTIIFPARVRLLSGHSCIVVEVAHASQFSWIYGRHDVPLKIKILLQENGLSIQSGIEINHIINSHSSKPARKFEPTRGVHEALAQATTKMTRRSKSDGVGPEDTKPILTELVRLGLDEDTYQRYLHHSHHSITRMLSYKVRRYRAGSPNLILHHKLEWIQRICMARNMKPSCREELRSLAIETSRDDWTPDKAR